VLRFSQKSRDLIDFGVHTIVCSKGAGIKRPRHESDLSGPLTAAIKIMWNYTLIFPFSL
jgi:hypothetical protein